MPNRTLVLSQALTISMALVVRIAGQGTPELQLMTRAADALGGRDRVMAVKTLQIIGYGELAYFQWRREHHRRPGRPSEVAEGAESQHTRTIDLSTRAPVCSSA